jgi:hypothetical protein
MKTDSGAITKYYAILDGRRVIAENGNKTGKYKGDVPVAQINLKVRVFGIGNAKYTLGIDLPGTAKDQELTLQLSQGYHELDLSI